ncbi:MAG TPA: FecR family protein, partial [Bryobacteraceae bacterium]|nr:FecR family protein [Bryobacteraceae bacterium]
MNTPEAEPNETGLDRTIREIQGEVPDPAVEQAAAERVWARLQPPLESCADFQALFSEYRAGTLPASRVWLLEDHLHQCVLCRRVLHPVRTLPERRSAVQRSRYARWAMAAALAIGAGLSAWGAFTYFRTAPRGSRARVESVTGTLLRVSEPQSASLRPGEDIPAGASIRTARDSGAFVRLEDGSRVEMGDRSEFSVTRSGSDLTIRLERGKILVEAAKRRAGHLYVATRDCRVAVTGTVFSVNAGLKGSRVTVVEGSVLVAQAGREQMLRPGQQYASDTSVEPVAPRQEIAWSRNLDAHLALLQAAAAAGERLDAVRFPDLRYTSTLLPLLPAGTVVFASLPNLSKPLGEVQQVFHDKVQGNPALAEWWQQNGAKTDAELTRLHAFSDYLGSEIVMAAVRQPSGSPGKPVFLAEVVRNGLEQFLADSGWPLRVAISGKVAVLAADAASLQQMTASLASGGAFTSTPFGAQLAALYRDGVGLLLAADLSSIGKPRTAPLPGAP